MAKNEKILMNSNGKIFMNTDNIILKSRPVSQELIPNGLFFWGVADPSYVTVDSGYVTRLNDVRGNGRYMIQNTVASKFYYTNTANGYALDINRYADIKMNCSNSSKMYNMFFVAKKYLTNTNGIIGNKYLGSIFCPSSYCSIVKSKSLNTLKNI